MSPLDSGDRRTLLEIARRAITEGVEKRESPGIAPLRGILGESASAFVTLWRGKNLRGCIGRISSNEPLGNVVAHAATSAALGDPRFAPVSREEVPGLEIEISVLSPFQKVLPEEVRAGVHGLMIEQGLNRGLLLPQVASEYRWSAERFLEETCGKAGLPRDAWRKPDTRIFVFTAEVFSEKEFVENKSGAESKAAPQ